MPLRQQKTPSPSAFSADARNANKVTVQVKCGHPGGLKRVQCCAASRVLASVQLDAGG